MSIFKQGCPKTDPSIILMVKNCVSHILFLRKLELIEYLAALKKGAIQEHKQRILSSSFSEKKIIMAYLWRCSNYQSTHKSVVKQIHSWLFK